MNIHVGCGKRNFGLEWLHVDGGTFDHLTSKDVFLRDFKDDCADVIYSSHLIAYFDREEVKRLLQEWYRVLKPNGILRVATPDFGIMAFLSHYAGEKWPIESFLGPLYGKMQLDDKTIYHKTSYTFSSLRDVLVDIGFKNPNRYFWQDFDIHRNNDDHSQSYLPKGNKENGTLISLNIQCTK